MIIALKASGAWAKRDFIHVIGATAAETHQNLKADQYNLVPSNSPSLLADRYCGRDGSTAHLLVGSALADPLTHYKQSDANPGAYQIDESSESSFIVGVVGSNAVGL